MALTYTCPHCGTVMYDHERYTHICPGTNQQKDNCPDCDGTGRSTNVTWIGTGQCSRCRGTGKIVIRH